MTRVAPVADTAIAKLRCIRCTGLTQKSYSVDFRTFLPYSLAGELHMISPGSDIWPDSD